MEDCFAPIGLSSSVTSQRAAPACRTTTQRAKEPKDRVHVTKHYEKKIDRIESRLASIEQLLRHSSHAPSCSSVEAKEDAPSPLVLEESLIPEVPPAGHTGIHAESIAAQKTFEQAVGREPSILHDPDIKSALESLSGIIDRAQHDTSGPLKSPAVTAPTKDATETYPPTWEQVKAVLQVVEGEKQAVSNWLSPAVLKDFCRKCQVMYEEGQEGSPTDKLLVYAIMSNICTEFSAMRGTQAADHRYNLARSFSHMLLQTLATFPMLTPPSMDAAEALLIAASTTIGMCKPSLSWTLTQNAARMCQVLGYNRLAHANAECDPLFTRKAILFWSIYTMDRNTSLRLGRGPALQDSDIDTPMPTPSDDFPAAMIDMVKFWVECGRVQGKISMQLYGPATSALAPGERAHIAEELADELEQIHGRKIKALSNHLPFLDRRRREMSAEFMIFGDDLMHCSNLSLALHAIPLGHPRRFRALEAARECLRLSRDINYNHLPNVYAWTVYCHWVLLHTPLTPFTGVFCNVIANPHTTDDDLELLEDFVASVKPARRLSEGVEKFYQLCSVFLKVAQTYVRAKARQDAKASSPSSGTLTLEPETGAFDDYLSTLGFLAPQAIQNDPMSEYSTGHNPHQPLFGTGSLLDPYSGNVSLYKLLDQDIDDINFGYLESNMYNSQ
ncbi:fungal specific transcription factor domain [Fusarium albosuccineum]|uniref:Fungal specific transcription factor domain n=1 Tax=Fusarium albosuccineum TaxID=1237068 RepID=A0A8H4L6Y4_9HYPO|nr:fungal specific transcription factor domain [Fusarium albosuccineum]